MMTQGQLLKKREGDNPPPINVLGKDLGAKICSKLPARSLACASCVSHFWNSSADIVLRRPKLSSAFSLKPSLREAVKDVLQKVLSQPLRPHFAVVCISPCYDLGARDAHRLITKALGFSIPVVTCQSRGVIGEDAITNQFEEVQWRKTVPADPRCQNVSPGILLTVGYLPGLKVEAIPLLRTAGTQVLNVDQFMRDIEGYTMSVSGCSSPAVIIMFGNPAVDMEPVLDKMDYAMSPETLIVGDESVHFLYRTGNSGNTSQSQNPNSVAIALVIARDRNKPLGIGDIEFNFELSTGLSPVGPTFKVDAVLESCEKCSTQLTAKVEEAGDILGDQAMLNEVYNEIKIPNENLFWFIGVTKTRQCGVDLENQRPRTSLVFHHVVEVKQEYLVVHGMHINAGDSFRFYHSDLNAALSSCSNVSEKFRRMKQDWEDPARRMTGATAAGYGKKEVFGGIIFSCCGRGESLFDDPNVDSTPFLENFPGVPLAGTFCSGEIARGSSSPYNQEAEEQEYIRCCLHTFSSGYLVMSYTPAQPTRA